MGLIRVVSMNILLKKIILLIKVIPAQVIVVVVVAINSSCSWINSTSRSIKETTERVSLSNINNLSDPETDPVLMK